MAVLELAVQIRLLVCAHMHARGCHSASVEVRAQLLGIGFLVLPCGGRISLEFSGILQTIGSTTTKLTVAFPHHYGSSSWNTGLALTQGLLFYLPSSVSKGLYHHTHLWLLLISVSSSPCWSQTLYVVEADRELLDSPTSAFQVLGL